MHTILVIEDQKLMRTMLCDRLKEEGYEVIEAEDGMEGLTKVESENVSMVITDLVMPNFDGVNFLGILVSCHPEVTVFSWTSLPRENTTYQDAAKIIGEDKIISKSGNMDNLIDNLKGVLK